MSPSLKRIRAAFAMGVLWGAGWAIIGGAIMEGIFDRDGRILDMWPQTLGIVGFLGGILFAIILGVVGGRRSFSEFSMVDFAALGAVAGVLQGALSIALVHAPVLFLGITIVCSAIAAVGSLGLARMVRPRALYNIDDIDAIR